MKPLILIVTLSKTVDMLKNWMRSLSARVWLTSIALLAVSLTILSATVIFSFERFPTRTLGRHEQNEYATGVAQGIEFNAAGRPTSVQLPDEDAWLIELVPNDLKYRILDAQGHILLRSNLSLDDAPWTNESLDLAAGKFEQVLIGARPYYLSTRRVVHGSEIFYAQAATSTRLSTVIVDQKIRAIPKSVNITFLTAALIFGLTLMFAAHRVMKPLREMSRAAARISPRNLAARLTSDRVPSEIKPLIDSFNGKRNLKAASTKALGMAKVVPVTLSSGDYFDDRRHTRLES
jgi:HAMP domain-containing protein